MINKHVDKRDAEFFMQPGGYFDMHVRSHEKKNLVEVRVFFGDNTTQYGIVINHYSDP